MKRMRRIEERLIELSTLLDQPTEQVRDTFFEWLGTTPNSFNVGMLICERRALRGEPMPWKTKIGGGTDEENV